MERRSANTASRDVHVSAKAGQLAAGAYWPRGWALPLLSRNSCWVVGRREGPGNGGVRVRDRAGCALGLTAAAPGEFCGLGGGCVSPESAVEPAADLAHYGGDCRGGRQAGRG